MTRRCPRRAELFSRSDTDLGARRREPPSPPHFPKSPSPPPAEAESNSLPVAVYFKQRYWKCYRALTGRDPNPGNSLLSAKNSICPPPEKGQLIVSDKEAPEKGQLVVSDQETPEKGQLIVSDKDDEQYDGDRHSSEFSYQTALYKLEEVDGGEDEQRTNHLPIPSKRQRQKSLSIAAYAVQCATCEKWRLIPAKQKYEELRAQIQMDPFTCEKAREWKPDVTCNDLSDVSQDGSWLWAMDKPNIPQPPQGFERLIAVRVEGRTRFADVYYDTPSGRTLRSTKDVENYLKENPEYAEQQGVNSSQFSFKIPAPARQDYVRKRAKANQNDGPCKESSNPLVEEGGEANLPVLLALCQYLPSKYTAQPIASSAPPMQGEPGDNNQLVPYNRRPT